MGSWGCWGNYRSLPFLNLSFHRCCGGLIREGRVGAAGPGCKLLPARRDRRRHGGIQHPLYLAWGGASPHPGFPWANPNSGFKSVIHTLGFWGGGPATRCFRPSCLRSPPPHMAWHLPPSVKGPSPSPSPAEFVALQVEQLRQARQGSRKTRVQGQTHLRDDLVSSLYLSFPSVMDPAQCSGPGSSCFSGMSCSLAASGFWRERGPRQGSAWGHTESWPDSEAAGQQTLCPKGPQPPEPSSTARATCRHYLRWMVKPELLPPQNPPETPRLPTKCHPYQ